VNIIFVEPSFPANQRRFALALASVGANVIGVGESEEWALDDPAGQDLVTVRRIRDEIDVRVQTLITELLA